MTSPSHPDDIFQRSTPRNWPLRYPSYAVFGIEPSMRFDGGSCVVGRVIRICRFGSGRFCYHRARRVCPDIQNTVLASWFLILSGEPVDGRYDILVTSAPLAKRWTCSVLGIVKPLPFQDRSCYLRKYLRRYAWWRFVLCDTLMFLSSYSLWSTAANLL